MPGKTDYTAENFLNYIGARGPAWPSLTSLFLALFTTAPTSDSGVTGATEVSGGGYARVQVAGQLTAGAAFTTSSSTITLASAAPAWLTALGSSQNGNGVSVYDVTNGQQIGTVSSISGTTVTLTANASHASSGSGDTLAFSAFSAPSASSGSEPAVTPANMTNGAQINFPTATANWGTVMAWGLFDASTSGNNLEWDYVGAGPWIDCTISLASPGVFTAHAHGYSAGATVVFSAKNAGTTPTFSQSNLTGPLLVVGPATDTFTVTNGGTAVNTSSSGDGQVRSVGSQSVVSGVTYQFPAGNVVLQDA